MRKPLYIAALSVLACGLATQAASAAPAPRPLTLYLAKVKPLNAAVVVAEASWLKAKAHPKSSNNSDPTVNRKALVATLKQTSTVLKRIVPPAALKQAHATLVSSLKLEAQGADGKANQLRKHWRGAVIAALHRAGLSVPAWVKSVRDPLA
jgi:hypothetical protein